MSQGKRPHPGSAVCRASCGSRSKRLPSSAQEVATSLGRPPGSEKPSPGTSPLLTQPCRREPAWPWRGASTDHISVYAPMPEWAHRSDAGALPCDLGQTTIIHRQVVTSSVEEFACFLVASSGLCQNCSLVLGSETP